MQCRYLQKNFEQTLAGVDLINFAIDVEIADLIAWIMDGSRWIQYGYTIFSCVREVRCQKFVDLKINCLCGGVHRPDGRTLNSYYSTPIYRYSKKLSNNIIHIKTLTTKHTLPFRTCRKKKISAHLRNADILIFLSIYWFTQGYSYCVSLYIRWEFQATLY